jgi:glycosyltransferase involved in cell wall biosynthesis
MKIACFLQGETTPSARFRILQYLQRFADAGIESVCFYPLIPKYGYVPRWLPERHLRFFVRRLSQLFLYLPHRWWQIRRAGLSGYDVVILQKQLAVWPEGAYLEKMIARRNPRVILDLDDAEFTDPANRECARAKESTKHVAALSMAVVVCNQYLENAVATAARVVVKIPTTVDERRFIPRARPPGEAVMIGWTGSASTVNYLRLVLPALEAVIERTGASLLIISDQTRIDWLAHIPRVRFLKWNAQDEVAQLHEIDIGIMPLPDDPWTRGKCAFKIIQYMAVGIPTVASPVGMNCEVTQDGLTGYFARSHEEWIESLKSLVRSATLRNEMGAAARQYFDDHLSGSRISAEWINLLNKLAGSRK